MGVCNVTHDAVDLMGGNLKCYTLAYWWPCFFYVRQCSPCICEPGDCQANKVSCWSLAWVLHGLEGCAVSLLTESAGLQP